MMYSYNECVGYDILDPTPREEWDDGDEREEVHEILDGRVCPFCGKPMMSDVYVVCGSLPDNWSHKYDILMHSRCLKDEMQTFLGAVGYTFTEDLGGVME